MGIVATLVAGFTPEIIILNLNVQPCTAVLAFLGLNSKAYYNKLANKLRSQKNIHVYCSKRAMLFSAVYL